MEFKLISMQKIEFSTIITMLIVPTIDGECGIMDNHEDIVLTLKSGQIKVFLSIDKNSDQELTRIFNIRDGFLEVHSNTAKILTTELQVSCNESNIKTNSKIKK